MENLWIRVVRIAVAVFLLYTILPFVMTRVLSLFVFKKAVASSAVAFTFDDGPDPAYTPQLLDLLKEYGVQAVFFVVGEKAQKHPELIRRMQEEGHLLGVHGYKHKPNWLLPPWVTRRHVRNTASILEQITGQKVTLFRPTWGLLNLGDLFTLRDFQVVLWSCMVGDWRSKIGKSSLKERLLQGIQEGTIVVLHDSGETFGADDDAPYFMIEALKEVLPKLQAKGLTFQRVDKMLAAEVKSKRTKLSVAKRVVVFLWMQWEKLFTKIARVRLIEGSNHFIHLRVAKYPGPTMVMEDGTVFRKGDRVAELHFDNQQLFEFGTRARSTTQLAILMIRGAEGMFPKIAEALATDPNYHDVKGLYAVSMINRGVQEFGLSVFDLPKGLFAWFTKFYLRLLMSAIHPRGRGRLKEQSDLLVPKMMLASRQEILRRFPVQNENKE